MMQNKAKSNLIGRLEKAHRCKSAEYIILAAICALSLVLCFSFFYGPNEADTPNSYGYVIDAHILGTNGPTYLIKADNVLGVRILFIGAIYLFQQTLGASRFSSVIFDVLCFVGTDLLIFMLGRELYSKRAGIVSALLYSFFPLAVFDAFSVGTNVPMAFLVTLSVFLVVKSAKEKRKKRRVLFVSLSAFISVIGYLVTPEEVIMLPVLLLLMVLDRKSYGWQEFAGFFGLALAAVWVMLLIGLVLASNPLGLYNLDIINQGGWLSPVFNQSSMPIYLDQMLPQGVSTLNSMLKILNVNFSITPVPDFDLSSPYYFGLYFYFVIAASLYLIIAREKRAIVPALWAVFGILYLGFGTESLQYYSHGLWYPLSRYTLLFWPALVLLLGFGFESAMLSAERYRKGAKRFARLVPYAILFIAIGWLFVQSLNSIEHLAMAQYSALYEMIEVGNYVNTLPLNATLYNTIRVPLLPFTDMLHTTVQFFGGSVQCNQFGVGYLVTLLNASFQEKCGISITYAAPPPPNDSAVFPYFSPLPQQYKNLAVYYKTSG